MKRVKSACIMQTLIFTQKDDAGYSHDRALAINREEVAQYKKKLNKAGTRYRIVSETEQEDGSILVRVKKQYNDTTDITEYFS